MNSNNLEDIIVVSVNISVERGFAKHAVSEIELNELGIIGDAHAGTGHRQVSILAQESIDKFSKQVNRKFEPGEFAENIIITGLDFDDISIFDIVKIDSVELEITQIGKKCHDHNCPILRKTGTCIMPDEGIFCRVIDGGIIKPGDETHFIPYALRFKIITISDRVSRGKYYDKSGPLIKQLLEEFFENRQWHLQIENIALPDNEELIRHEIEMAKSESIDVVITTGGTGIGPRDITPDVIEPLCDKIIPGIMEFIRIKYGTENPNALLSRSIAGIMGKTLIYTLPGSVRAVEEYAVEILNTIEHIILLINGIDPHR